MQTIDGKLSHPRSRLSQPTFDTHENDDASRICSFFAEAIFGNDGLASLLYFGVTQTHC